MEKKVNYLSKSDFKVAQTCATKLFYKKNNYPNAMSENEYMQMLADGGYLIGKYAQLMYPNGKEVAQGNPQLAFQETEQHLEKEGIILFEAAIISRGKVIRIDILKKDKNKYEILEVKAKSGDSEDDNKKIDAEYMDDVVFQYYVLHEYLTDKGIRNFTIDSYLLMPDKSYHVRLDKLPMLFKDVTKKSIDSNFRKKEYEFAYPLNGEQHKQLIDDNFLTLLNLNDYVLKNLNRIESNAHIYLNSLNPLKKIAVPINKNCFKCEYKIEQKENNGFRECWGKLADISPSISELYHLGTIANDLADTKIKEGKVSLFDIQEEELVSAKGSVGKRNIRQLIQLQNARANTEYFSDAMKSEMKSLAYPLYFIDFETSTYTMPYYAGMRPYELLAFQWSCHRVDSPGAIPVHSEWINTENNFPNFRFAESLMQAIGENGTPLMWSHHENTVLTAILKQAEARGYKNQKVINWLSNIIKLTDDKKKVLSNGRLFDQNKFCHEHYFHPYMKGKTSIKKVLPAVWNHNPLLHQIPYFTTYFAKDAHGNVISPYDTLKSVSDVIEDQDEIIKEGTAAMRAYHQMMFEEKEGSPAFENKKQLLLQYCKLDTMAMVIIWEHWRRRNGLV